MDKEPPGAKASATLVDLCLSLPPGQRDRLIELIVALSATSDGARSTAVASLRRIAAKASATNHSWSRDIDRVLRELRRK